MIETNWYNEMFKELGWIPDELIFDTEEPDHGKMERSQTEPKRSERCSFCGTRTGLHGFSFDKKVF